MNNRTWSKRSTAPLSVVLNGMSAGVVLAAVHYVSTHV